MSEFYFDEAAADTVVRFIETKLTHVKGELGGKPFILAPWEKKVVRDLFGWKETKQYNGVNLRQYRQAFIFVPRKNDKSTLCSALAIVSLLLDPEPGAVVISAAADKNQARLVFDDAKKMIRQNGFLSDNVQVYQHSIIKGNSNYQPLSADVETKHGLNISFTIFDELHTQPNRHLYDVLQTSQGARRQPMFIMITTAGYDLNSICYEQYDYAKKVRDGIIKDDQYYVAIYEASPSDNPFDEETWKKANPGYGYSLKPDFIKREAEKAKSNKAYLNTFLRLHLNIWTAVDEVWITDDKWQRCGGKYKRDELYEKLKYCKCSAGMDLSNTSDITAFTLMFPPDNTREFEPTKYISLNWFWLPEEKGRDSADKNNNNYLQWVSDGWIEETPGNVIDYDLIYDRILEIVYDFELYVLCYDPAFSVQIAAKLEKELGEGRIYRHSQAQKAMSAPTMELERLVTDEKERIFLHDNNPVMRWMVSNTVLIFDSRGQKMNNPLVKPGKNQPHQKIDGLITNIISLSPWLEGEDTSEGSYLDENDVLFVNI